MKLASNGVVNTPSLSHITSTKLSIKLEQDNRQNGEHNSPFSIIQGFPLLREYALNRRIDLLDIKTDNTIDWSGYDTKKDTKFFRYIKSKGESFKNEDNGIILSTKVKSFTILSGLNIGVKLVSSLNNEEIYIFRYSIEKDESGYFIEEIIVKNKEDEKKLLKSSLKNPCLLFIRGKVNIYLHKKITSSLSLLSSDFITISTRSNPQVSTTTTTTTTTITDNKNKIPENNHNKFNSTYTEEEKKRFTQVINVAEIIEGGMINVGSNIAGPLELEKVMGNIIATHENHYDNLIKSRELEERFKLRSGGDQMAATWRIYDTEIDEFCPLRLSDNGKIVTVFLISNYPIAQVNTTIHPPRLVSYDPPERYCSLSKDELTKIYGKIVNVVNCTDKKIITHDMISDFTIKELKSRSNTLKKCRNHLIEEFKKINEKTIINYSNNNNNNNNNNNKRKYELLVGGESEKDQSNKKQIIIRRIRGDSPPPISSTHFIDDSSSLKTQMITITPQKENISNTLVGTSPFTALEVKKLSLSNKRQEENIKDIKKYTENETKIRIQLSKDLLKNQVDTKDNTDQIKGLLYKVNDLQNAFLMQQQYINSVLQPFIINQQQQQQQQISIPTPPSLHPIIPITFNCNPLQDQYHNNIEPQPTSPNITTTIGTPHVQKISTFGLHGNKKNNKKSSNSNSSKVSVDRPASRPVGRPPKPKNNIIIDNNFSDKSEKFNRRNTGTREEKTDDFDKQLGGQGMYTVFSL